MHYLNSLPFAGIYMNLFILLNYPKIEVISIITRFLSGLIKRDKTATFTERSKVSYNYKSI